MTKVLNADLVLEADTDFARSKMARRSEVALDEAGVEAFFVASPEDVVLSKLLWRKSSGSMKQWTDILGILKVRGALLETDYLQRWSQKLGITGDLERAIEEASF